MQLFAEPLLNLLRLQACQLLRDMADLSAPGSQLLMTCADRTLYEVGQGLHGRYAYFANMWHFCIDDLLGIDSLSGTNTAALPQQGGEQQGPGDGAVVKQPHGVEPGDLGSSCAHAVRKPAGGPPTANIGAGDENVTAVEGGVEAVPRSSALGVNRVVTGGAGVSGVFESPLGVAGWELQTEPETTAAIALQRYGMETYVAEYGGAECYFSSKLKQNNACCH